MRDQAENLRQLVENVYPKIPQSPVIKYAAAKARVVTVTSGKGGVGKTNLTVNLALAMAKLGRNVLVIDADLGMANVDVVLGCSASHTILNLLEDGVTLNDIITEGPCGIKFVSGGSGICSLANLGDHDLKKIVGQIAAVDGWADIILIDTGAGLNKNVLNFVVAADEVIIITTPEPTAITDAYAIMKAYASYNGSAPLRLVVNRVQEQDEGSFVVNKLINVALRFLGLSVSNLGFVYEDRNMLRAVKSQTPLVLSYPDTISAKCIAEIANRLMYGDEVVQTSGLKGFFNKFFTLIR
jgi:flagellar biosynthesis protein FlhG